MDGPRNLSPAVAVIKVSAVMPCLNEARTIGTCIEKAFKAFDAMQVVGEVVIADNGSSDGSAEIAASMGARVVRVLTKGYGAALSGGILAARGEFVVMADSDDSYDWLGIEPFIRQLEQGMDLVVGNRFLGGIDPGAMPHLHRYLGNPVLSWLARTVHRAPVGDFHCGMRAFRRSAFERMNARAPGMEFATEMIVNSAKVGLRMAEVPTRLSKDGRNRPPHLRSFRDGWRHLRFILTYGPNYLYLAPGGGLFGLGLTMMLALAGGPITVGHHYFGIHFLALACALTLVGFNIVTYGVLAKVVAMRRMPEQASRLANWALLNFRLEKSLLLGGGLILLGVASDVYLLLEWLSADGASMDSTVHAVFVATLMIVLGVSFSLASFLLHMLVHDIRD